jgi:hypothetical protein
VMMLAASWNCTSEPTAPASIRPRWSNDAARRTICRVAIIGAVRLGHRDCVGRGVEVTSSTSLM